MEKKEISSENIFDNYCGEADPLNLGGTDNLYGLANDADTLGLNNLSIEDLGSKKMSFMDYEVEDDIVMVTNVESFLEIIEQPINKFRFRYKAEMQGTHGQLKGINNNKKSNKTFPTIQLHGYTGEAVIHCSVHQDDANIQSHRLLIRKNNKTDGYDPIEIIVNAENNYTAEFRGMGIMFIKKDDIEENLMNNIVKEQESLLKKKLSKTEKNKIEKDCKLKIKTINMNEITLSFQAFEHNATTGKLVSLCEPVLSDPIQHNMGTKTGNLKIIRSSKIVGKAIGDEEIILLTEKVDKDNIKVRFYELNEDGDRIWEEYAKFPPSNVHRQFAIMLNTPPYRKIDIEEKVQVYIELFRPGKGNVIEESSLPIRFTYLPCEVFQRKRKKSSNEAYDEFVLPPMKEEIQAESCDSDKSLELSLQHLIKNFGDSNLCTENFVEHINSNDLINLNITDDYLNNSNSLMTDNSLNTLNHASLTQIPMIYNYNLLHRYIRLGRIADAKNALKIVLILKKLSLLQCKNENNETCLHVACLFQKHDIVKSLLTAGVDPNFINKEGDAALHISINSGDICMVSIFCECIKYPSKLSKTFDKDLTDFNGMSYLHLAIKKSCFSIVKKLIEIGASTSICTGNSNYNILHLAVEQEDESILKYLIKFKKDLINQKNCTGETPLTLAKSLKKDNYYRILIQDMSYEINKKHFDMSNSLDSETIRKLSIILNENDKWKELAKLLGLEHFICAWTSAATLLNHINRTDSIQIDQIVVKLKELKEPEIDQIITKYVKDVIGIK